MKPHRCYPNAIDIQKSYTELSNSYVYRRSATVSYSALRSGSSRRARVARIASLRREDFSRCVRCVVNRDLQLVSLPKLFTLEIIIQEDVDSICGVRTMERNTDEESDAEDGFTLGERDFALVKRTWTWWRARDGPAITNALVPR